MSPTLLRIRPNPCGFALLGAAGLLLLASGAARAATVTRNPYVQLTTPGSAVVVWRTDAAITPVLKFGATPQALNQEVSGSAVILRVDPLNAAQPPNIPRLSEAPAGIHQYEAFVTGLQPDTRYYYCVHNGEDPLAGGDANHYFRSAPAPTSTRPMRFWIVGDSGVGSQVQIDGFQSMVAYAEADGRPIDAFLHMGDIAYGSGTDLQFGAYFFNIYKDLLRNTVTWPTLGNHDGYSGTGELRPYFDAYVLPAAGEAGGAPSGTEQYYSFDIGKVHFICLQSYDLPRTAQGAMAQWLQADLDATHSEWLIAFWHHPPYSRSTHDSDWEDELIEMREVFMPILEAGGVDLVLCGHSHGYERSMLIDGAYATPTIAADGVVLDAGDGNRDSGDGAYQKSAGRNSREGTVAVVAGHGAGAYIEGVMPVMKRQIAQTGSFILDLEDDTFTGIMLGSDGEEYDRFHLRKSGQTKPKVVYFQPQPGVGAAVVSPAEPEPGVLLRYSLNGSDPTEDSPIVGGPVTVPHNATLRVRTFWPNGLRQSGTTVSTPSGLLPGFAVRLPPGESDNDATEALDGDVDLNGLQLLTEGRTAVRFSDVGIPTGATILTAYMQFTSAGASAAQAIACSCEFTGDSGLLVNDPQNLSLRAPTLATVSWNAPAWAARGLRTAGQRTPNLAALLQEVVVHPEWGAGRNITFLFDCPAAHPASATDDTDLAPPELTVTFLPFNWPKTLASQPFSLQIPSNGPVPATPVLTFHRLRSAARDGVLYGLECSPDLRNWSPLPLSELNPPQAVNPIYENVTLGLPFSGPRQYYRLRISR